MDLNDAQLSALEELVNELMKPAPEETKVRSCLKLAGLHDPRDPLARIQTVLDALRFELPDKELNE